MSKLIDLLDEDRSIAEQKFVCLSFISPERILKKKELFLFEQFVKQFHFNKSAELLTQYSNFIAFKYGLNNEDLSKELKEFAENETEKMHISVEDDYKNFLDRNEETLEKQFSKEHQFQTTVRGVKVRGVFPSQEEAELRCKLLREIDPNHDIYVGPVGIWVPFHPDAYKTGKVEHLEKELNELMHEKKNNEDKAKMAFDKRVKESKLQAIQENMELANEHGNKLTQTINDKGELIGIENATTTEKTLGLNASMADIENELFHGEDVAPKDSDHGLSTLMRTKTE